MINVGANEIAKPYLDKIATGCIKKRMTLSVAESVTSGFLQLLFSNANNTQSFFQGGITVYNAAQKTRHLAIEPIYAADCNCVSVDIAVAMATEVTTLFCSDLGIAITGYATPIPEEQIQDLFAYVAIVSKKGIIWKGKIKPAKKDTKGWMAQREYALQVIKRLANVINK